MEFKITYFCSILKQILIHEPSQIIQKGSEIIGKQTNDTNHFK